MDPWDDVEGATPTGAPPRSAIKDTKSVLEAEIALRGDSEDEGELEDELPTTPLDERLMAHEPEPPPPPSTDRAVAALPRSEPQQPVTREPSVPAGSPEGVLPGPPPSMGTPPARGGLEVPRWAILGGLTFVAVLGVLATRQVIAGRSVDAALASAVATYEGRDFVGVSPSFFDQERLEVAVDRPSCFIALAVGGSGEKSLVVARPSGTVTGEGSVGWCTCGPEDDTVHVESALGSAGVRVLRAEAGEVGGDYGLFLLEPPPRATAPPGECAGKELEGWIRAGKAKPKLEDGGLSGPLRGKLAENGFALAATAPTARSFALVLGVKDSCWLAWSGDPADTLTVRTPDGKVRLEAIKGAVGSCAEQPTSAMVGRDGRGTVFVAEVAAGRIGGAHGLREAATRLGFTSIATWVNPSELSWDAAATLRADKISAPEIEISTDGHAIGQARFVALSLAGATVHPEGEADVAYACEPALAAGVPDALCVQGTGLRWDLQGPGGVAESALPFWMHTFEAAIDPRALRVELALAKLGRRLAAEGFEPTILGGLTEPDGSIVILGQPGDDAVVAVDLARETPWAIPCSDGPPWSIVGDPRRVGLGAGAKLRLSCPRGAASARIEGHAVVFRHKTSH